MQISFDHTDSIDMNNPQHTLNLEIQSYTGKTGYKYRAYCKKNIIAKRILLRPMFSKETVSC